MKMEAQLLRLSQKNRLATKMCTSKSGKKKMNQKKCLIEQNRNPQNAKRDQKLTPQSSNPLFL